MEIHKIYRRSWLSELLRSIHQSMLSKNSPIHMLYQKISKMSSQMLQPIYSWSNHQNYTNIKNLCEKITSQSKSLRRKTQTPENLYYKMETVTTNIFQINYQSWLSSLSLFLQCVYEIFKEVAGSCIGKPSSINRPLLFRSFHSHGK